MRQVDQRSGMQPQNHFKRWVGVVLGSSIGLFGVSIYGLTKYFNVQEDAAAEHQRYKEYHRQLEAKSSFESAKQI